MKTAREWSQWLENADLLIRTGRSRLARKAIEAFLASPDSERIERARRGDLARLCRRAGIPHRAIQLLNPLVRPKARAVLRATSQEIAEYAAALIQVGADLEGQKLLDSLDSRALPEVFLFDAFARFSKWDYASAIPLLESFLTHPALTPYEKQVGTVNLAAALVAEEQHERAETLLEPLIRETREEKNYLLLGNALLIRAQQQIDQKSWDAARASLEEAQGLLKQVESLDELLIRKWQAVLELKTKGASAGCVSALAKVREEAMRRRHWETARDCDFYLALEDNDKARLQRLYFGTPFPAYRRRIENESGLTFTQGYYEWECHTNPEAQTDGVLIDSLSGEIDEGGPTFKAGQIPQRLLQILASDFYRPQRLASLHEQLHPDRYFNPQSSPAVVHQAIRRLRSWTKKQRVPLAVREQLGAYDLQARKACRLKLYRHTEPEASSNGLRFRQYFNSLEERLGENFRVSRAQAAQIWKVSSRSAFGYLNSAVREGRLAREGRGPSTKYFKPPRAD